MHEHEHVADQRSGIGRGDSKVEQRVAAAQLFVGEHAGLDAQALGQQFAVVGGVAQEQL